MSECATNRPATHRCPQCGEPVACGLKSGCTDCWCMSLPHVVPMSDAGADCLCRSCLSARIAKLTAAAGSSGEGT